MPAFPFDFRALRPQGLLEPAVEQIWYARGTVPYRRELIAPTGSCVALVILGDPIRMTPADGASICSDQGLVLGPHTAPVTNEPTGETFAIGIITSPVGAEAALGIAPRPIRGRVVPSAEVSVLPRLREVLVPHRHDDPDTLLGLAVEVLTDHAQPLTPQALVAERAVRLVNDDPRRPISDIAHELGVSHGHLDRLFTAVVGISPRALARLLLLRRILTELDPHQPVPWVELAAEHGWADQAHFSRDFTRHTGTTPGHYLEVQREFEARQGSPASGFTPDLDGTR